MSYDNGLVKVNDYSKHHWELCVGDVYSTLVAKIDVPDAEHLEKSVNSEIERMDGETRYHRCINYFRANEMVHADDLYASAMTDEAKARCHVYGHIPARVGDVVSALKFVYDTWYSVNEGTIVRLRDDIGGTIVAEVEFVDGNGDVERDWFRCYNDRSGFIDRFRHLTIDGAEYAARLRRLASEGRSSDDRVIDHEEA